MNGRTEAKPVLDGNRLKWTLEQVRAGDPGLVRLDWLRFTLPLDAVCRGVDGLADLEPLDLVDQRTKDLMREIRGTEVVYTTGPAVAREGARRLVELLGDGFACGLGEARGMDFYSSRCGVLRQGEEVAVVLSGSQKVGQAGTVHFNLYGSCMLWIGRDVYEKLHNWITSEGGQITRVDLALDVFDGADVAQAQDAYLAGDFDVRGKRPGQRNIGSWALHHSRTFEVGGREAGKLMRCYEKGDQVFGHEANDPWVRYEVEIRNNNRVIDPAVLQRPGDFFAGAYPFCESLLSQEKAAFVAQAIPRTPRLQEATAEGECTRVVRWLANAAAPTVAAVLHYAGDAFEQIVLNNTWRTPSRLVGFSPAELQQAFQKVASAFIPRPPRSLQGA